MDDLVLDHDIPHLWVRKNSLTDRKTQASIRCVPLLGVSLEALTWFVLALLSPHPTSSGRVLLPLRRVHFKRAWCLRPIPIC
jgi:hypothetical protein